VIGILLLIIILEGLFIIITRPKKARKIPVAIKAKIAIVIDDWGYNLNNLPSLEQIKYPLTVAVLPNLVYSRIISEELYKRGFEIILHLPLEPREKYRLERNTILTSLDDTTIRNILEQDLTNIAYARGVSGHMGSRATEDPSVMETIFKDLKRRRLYFLDSIVSSKSVCSDLARRMGLGFAKRDVFLDNKEEPAYIRGQLYKLKLLARTKGHAIGIGHDHRITLEVLKEAMPEMEKEGYRFVFVSELVK
jgi:hypothetical protein